MQLRANLTNRLVLKVADKKNSILVLDEPGGGKNYWAVGIWLQNYQGKGRVILAQVPFASESEIAELGKHYSKGMGVEP
ncbi:Uncharacterised protein [Escherichia coli]|uniref:Uncharacterized protein n=1 Tax=Escherichia coli TaxID=562 RepID=A0A376TLT0_ECOLX|nr:Uncharacterised protein [Escherichia coli]